MPAVISYEKRQQPLFFRQIRKYSLEIRTSLHRRSPPYGRRSWFVCYVDSRNLIEWEYRGEQVVQNHRHNEPEGWCRQNDDIRQSGACLASLGKKVLLVDIDPQGNTTSGVGINKADVENCIYDVLINEVDPHEAVIPTAVPNLSIIPATIQLAGAEIELVPTSRERSGSRNRCP